MALNKQHFQDGINKIWSQLNEKNKSKDIIEQSKKKLLDLFLDDNAGLTSHEEVNEAFDHVKTLLQTKMQEATQDEELRSEYKQLLLSNAWSNNHYSEQYLENNTSIGERTQQLKQLYDKIKTLQPSEKSNNNNTTQNTNINITESQQNNKTEQDKGNDSNSQELQVAELKLWLDDNVQKLRKLLDGEFIEVTETTTGKTFTLKLKRWRYLLSDNGTYQWEITPQEIKERFNLDVNLVDEILQLREKKNLLPAVIDDKNNLPAIIEKESDLPVMIEKPKPTLDDTIKSTQNDLFWALSIDAHLMDKENLIYESERNRIRDLSERKYESANRFKKVGMFATDRRSQRRELKDSIDSSVNNNNFIEANPLQNRIEGMIWTYANQTNMGMDNLTVNKDRRNVLHNNTVDSIAHDYLSGSITRDIAITAFNNALSLDDSLRVGRMTGTDLIKQIDTVRNDDTKRTNYIIKTTLFSHIKNTYNNTLPTTLSDTDIATIQTQLNTNSPFLQEKWKQITPDQIRAQLEVMKKEKIEENIGKMNEKSLRVRVNLFKIYKHANTEELEGVKYDKIDKWPVAWLSKMVSKLWVPWSIAMKVATWAIIAGTGWAPLYALWGSMLVWSILQYLKTYRDSTREIAKTHEDAINLWLPELERRIADLETQQQNAGMFARIGATMGRNARNRRAKQIQILNAFREMRQDTHMLRWVDSIVNDLNTTWDIEHNTQIMSDVLARIDMGHKHQTQFISTTDTNWNPIGRQQTAIKRNEMMEALKKKAISTPLSIVNADGTISSIRVNEQSQPDERNQYRQTLKTNRHYNNMTQYLSENYETVQKNIRSTRRSLWWNAVKQYVLNTAAAAIVAGGIKTGIDYINSPDAVPWTAPITDTTPKVWEQSHFKLSQYQNGNETQLPDTESFSNLKNGDIIENAKAEVSVDAVAAKAGSFDNYLQVADKVRTEIGWLWLDATTQKTLQEALSTSRLDEVMKEGASQIADEGNQKLLALRWTNMIENFAKELHDNNLNEVVVKNIKRTDDIADMAIQWSKNGISHADLAHRWWALVAEATNNTTGENVDIPLRESINNFFPKETYLAWVFPFFNTYARPWQKKDERAYNIYPKNNKQDTSKRKIWRKDDKKDDQVNNMKKSTWYKQAA